MTIRVHHYEQRDGIDVCKYCGAVRNRDAVGPRWCPGRPPQITCRVPPPGWHCTRADGHDGPCAAVRDPREELEELRAEVAQHCIDAQELYAALGILEHLPTHEQAVACARALRAEVARLREALRDIRDNYDHDVDAHRYGTACRSCSAAEALGEPARGEDT